MPNSDGIEQFQSVPDTFRSGSLSGVRHARQACIPSQAKEICELLRWILRFSSAQPQCDNAPVHCVDRESGTLFADVRWHVADNVEYPLHADAMVLSGTLGTGIDLSQNLIECHPMDVDQRPRAD